MANKKPNKLNTLKSSSDFNYLKKNGSKIRTNRWLLIVYCKRNDIDFTRFGWTLPKYVGTAVVRNRIKRWCREFFRTQEQLFKNPVDINLVFLKMDSNFYGNLKRDEFLSTIQKGNFKLQKFICSKDK